MSGQREATEGLRTLIAVTRGAIPARWPSPAEANALALAAAVERVLDLCDRGDYTTWDVDEHLPGKGWKPDDPKVLAWEAAHGHDARLKCYPEFGCQLLLDPEDVRSALLGEP